MIRFINGVRHLVSGTSCFYAGSPYSLIPGAMRSIVPAQFVDRAEHLSFRTEVQLVRAEKPGTVAFRQYLSERLCLIISLSS
jgi:hypothetical protein